MGYNSYELIRIFPKIMSANLIIASNWAKQDMHFKELLRNRLSRNWDKLVSSGMVPKKYKVDQKACWFGWDLCIDIKTP